MKLHKSLTFNITMNFYLITDYITTYTVWY